MNFEFTESDLARIGEVLGADGRADGNSVRFKLHDELSQRSITLEITRGLTVPQAMKEERADTLVTVMAPSSLLQLQGCTGYIASQELGEVIFFARRGGITNGLVVERQAACSLYANFDERLLSTDFAQLSPELIMSAVALSMTETLFNDLA